MKKGLTLVELVMVLAVLAIIGAILVPNFLSTTDRARLKSDIQSARVIENAMELYRSERGLDVAGGNDVAKIVTNLKTQGYLKEGTVLLQTAKAAWVKNASGVIVDISDCDEDSVKKKAYSQLSDLEKPYVTGGINSVVLNVTGEDENEDEG